MLSRPTTDLLPHPEPEGSRWDRNPGTRLTLLGLAMVVPLLPIGWRVASIMYHDGDHLAPRKSPVTVTTHLIPTHGGRILAADGSVLAHDEQRFGVLVHYRWLEFPPDPSWLKGQALARLEPRERRNATRVAAARSEVLARRETMLEELALLCRVSRDDLARRMDAVQRRVERVVEAVKRRQSDDGQPANSPANSPAPSASITPASLLQALKIALTTPPSRSAREPVVVTEELEYHRLLDNIPLESAAAIEEHPERFPGVGVRIETRRIYGHGSLAAHVVGTSHLRSDHRGIVPDREWVGASGVEKTYDHVLRGRAGKRRVVTNRHGEVVSTRVLEPPRRGHDIQLTLSLYLQRQAERILDEATSEGSPGGAIVVIDLHTGAVRAAASAPRFDPNLVITPDAATWKSLLEDPRRPLFCRVTGMALPPGSVFKALSATALIQSGVLGQDHSISCRGFLDQPTRHRCYIFSRFGVGHGHTDLGDALCRSCNVFFFDAARRLARSGPTGHNSLHLWAARFGFGRPTGIDLPGESAGRLPDPPARPLVAETMQLAIGQGPITATPLQVVRMMAAIANGGSLVTPYVVSGLGPDPRVLATRATPRTTPIPGLRRQTLEIVRSGLKRVVEDPRGTGYKRVRLPGIAIAGKTGTAEVGGDLEDHAWFAGYVPADSPRFAFVVVLEHAGSGGREAGPLARRLVQAIQASGLIGPAHAGVRRPPAGVRRRPQ